MSKYVRPGRIYCSLQLTDCTFNFSKDVANFGRLVYYHQLRTILNLSRKPLFNFICKSLHSPYKAIKLRYYRTIECLGKLESR
jgi:hypothetical protein